MSKVVHINLIGPGYPNTGWQKAFAENGYDEYIQIDWVRLKLERGVERMWVSIISKLRRENPDLIFMQIHSKEIFTPSVVLELNSICRNIVLYNIDARTEEESKWIYDVAPFVSLCALSNMRDVNIINKENKYRAILCQSSCDMDYYMPDDNGIFKYGSDIVFLGNNYQRTTRNFPLCNYRQSVIGELHRTYRNKFKCYGRRQEKPMVFPAAEVAIYQQAKIAICFSNFDLDGYTSDRIWRAMACGCFVLAKHFNGIESMFENKKHLDTWHSIKDLKNKIDHYLNSPIERAYYAQEGCRHVRSNHSLTNRVRQILEAL